MVLRFISRRDPKTWLEYKQENGVIMVRSDIDATWKVSVVKSLEEAKSVALSVWDHMIVDPNDLQPATPDKCTCSITQLMRGGCNCGGK